MNQEFYDDVKFMFMDLFGKRAPRKEVFDGLCYRLGRVTNPSLRLFNKFLSMSHSWSKKDRSVHYACVSNFFACRFYPAMDDAMSVFLRALISVDHSRVCKCKKKNCDLDHLRTFFEVMQTDLEYKGDFNRVLECSYDSHTYREFKKFVANRLQTISSVTSHVSARNIAVMFCIDPYCSALYFFIILCKEAHAMRKLRPQNKVLSKSMHRLADFYLELHVAIMDISCRVPMNEKAYDDEDERKALRIFCKTF